MSGWQRPRRAKLKTARLHAIISSNRDYSHGECQNIVCRVYVYYSKAELRWMLILSYRILVEVAQYDVDTRQDTTQDRPSKRTDFRKKWLGTFLERRDRARATKLKPKSYLVRYRDANSGF